MHCMILTYICCRHIMYLNRTKGMQELGLLSFSSVLNVHCKHSFGFRMVSPSGKTFVFSGDTEKCENVIDAAKEADILVHEATFESDMIADAKFKKHSTIEVALAVCSNALCHFHRARPHVNGEPIDRTVLVTAALDVSCMVHA